MLLRICGLRNNEPGPRLADFVIPPCCQAFRCSSGPLVQFTLRLTSATTGTDSCLQVIVVLLRIKKTKLRQDTYAVQVHAFLELFTVSSGTLIRLPEQFHEQSTSKTQVQQLSDVSSSLTVYWNLFIWPAILPPMYWETTGATVQRRNTRKMAEILISAHILLLDSIDVVVVNLKKNATAFFTAHNEVCKKLSSRLYSYIPLPSFLGSTKEVEFSSNLLSSVRTSSDHRRLTIYKDVLGSLHFLS